MKRDLTVREDRIAWNDVEALPLYGAALLTFAALLYLFVDRTSAMEDMAAKLAILVGCLGLRRAWVGMDADGR
ncbi:hypothetical protein [Sphingomonas morindae]|uniref:Uncharacterized protein n=1 Tax=Sphingomonas morindae TaxID=1541170 RepID=A0ABY4X695_9SPHN|nr:hypothetical protein [Sphingomonas morindae]USI72433.1 hypothetical protein LHA26_14205 [Sphingomonas morindae]